MRELIAGIYAATAKTATAAKTSNGKDQLVIEFEVTHRAESGEWLALPEVKSRRVYLFLTPAAWQYSQEKLETLEFNGDFNAPSFGKPDAQLECRYEEYNGAQHEKWDLVGGQREIAKADDKTILDLNAKWKAKAKPAGTPPAPPKSKPLPAAPPTGSEIPF